MKKMNYFLTAVWVSVVMSATVTAEQREIALTDKVIEVEIGEDVELMVSVYPIDIDVEVFGEDRSSVRLEFEKLDLDEMGPMGPRVFLDEEAGHMSIKLGPMVDGKVFKVIMPSWMATRVKGTDGSIRVQGIHGEIDVSTVDGDIDLLDARGGIVAHTVDGEVRIVLKDTQLESPVSLAAVDGDIEVWVGAELSAKVNVSTIEGEFKTEIPVNARHSGETFPWGGVNLTGTYGAGGAELFLKTIDGDIEVRLRK